MVAHLRAEEDRRYTDVYDLYPDRPVKIFTLGHDDCVRRKHNMKVCNVLLLCSSGVLNTCEYWVAWLYSVAIFI